MIKIGVEQHTVTEWPLTLTTDKCVRLCIARCVSWTSASALSRLLQDNPDVVEELLQEQMQVISGGSL